MNNIYEEVFGIQLTKDEIIATIAFKILGGNKNESIILVEGSTDVEIYEVLSKRINDFKPFFVDCGNKESALSYLEYDNNQFAILDRDFDKNDIKNNKIYFTRYANIEADLLNEKDINEYIKNAENCVKENGNFIKIIEEIEKSIYVNGMYTKNKIRYKFKFEWLSYNKNTLINQKIYTKIKPREKVYIGDGIHCAKTLIKIIAKINRKSYNDIIKELLGSTSDTSPAMNNIVNIYKFIKQECS